jgi:hypothetical protein
MSSWMDGDSSTGESRVLKVVSAQAQTQCTGIYAFQMLQLWVDTDYSQISMKLRQKMQQWLQRQDASRVGADITRQAKAFRLYGIPAAPVFELPSWNGPVRSLRELSDAEIVRGLTMIEFHLFSKVEASEFRKQAWIKPNHRHHAPNILASIARFNEVRHTERKRERENVCAVNGCVCV